MIAFTAPAPAPVTCPIATRGSVVFRAKAAASTDMVRLGDIADMTALPAGLRGHAASIVIAKRTETNVRLAIPPILPGLRGRMPILACWLPRNVPGEVIISRMSVAKTTSPPEASSEARPNGDLHRGDTINLAIAVGAVRIERQVEALQPAKPGQRLFVRDADGKTLSVRYAESSQ